MNIKTHPRFLFLVNVGLVFVLLIGCATPVARPVEDVENAEPLDQFGAELESLNKNK